MPSALFVDGQPFAIAGVAVRAEHRKLGCRAGRVGIRVPLANAEPFVAVVDVAQPIVHDDGFDFAGLARRWTDAAERAESAHERGLELAAIPSRRYCHR